jgi:hypothetical protein
MDLQQPSLTSRVNWCKKIRNQTSLKEDKEAWIAEEAGLRDAILGRERLTLFRLCYPSLVKRYMQGFQDGRTLIGLSP